MKVSTKLAGGYLALILIFGGLLVFYHRVVQKSARAGRELAAIDSRVLLASTTQLDLLDQIEEDASKYHITGDSGYLRAYDVRRLSFEDTLRVLQTMPVRGGPREALANLVAEWEEFQSRFGDIVERVGDVGAPDAQESEWTGFLAATEDLRRRTRDLRVSSLAGVASQIRSISRDAERATVTGWISMAVALVLAGVLAVLIVRSITGPLEKIEAGAAAVAKGDFDVRVEVPGRDELSRLGESFNEMAERLGDLDRAKRDFLASVSHDLKTPLASIHQIKRLLIGGVPGPLTEKQERLLQLGLGNVERLGSMISKLLELSRLEAGVEEYRFETLDLVEVCSETVERFNGHDDSPLSFSGAEASIRVEADRGALTRVLENLLENARTHGRGGRVEVSVAVEDARAVVRVRDHGRGVPVEDRERIFDRFSRPGPSASEAGNVGLGLAICRQIIEAHDGRIRVSEASGGGSVFAFDLPVKEGSGSRGSERGSDHTREQGTPLTPVRSLPHS